MAVMRSDRADPDCTSGFSFYVLYFDRLQLQREGLTL